MQFKALTTAIGALALSLSPGLAGATIVYDTWTTNEGDSGNYILTVTENLVDDVFEVELTVDPWNAEALGLFIDLGNADVGDDTLTNASPAGQVTVVATDTDSNSCGSGCSLNGLSPTLAVPDGQWEWVIRLGAQGFDGIQTFSFDLARNGLSEDDWGLVGARAQQLCDAGEVLPDGSCGGSDKSFSSGAPAPVPLPEPGTLALMAVGLAGIRFAGRAGRALS